MKNFVQPGHAIDVVTPAAGYTAGKVYLVGALHGVAASTTVSGEDNVLHTSGVYNLDKVGSQAWAIGDPVYWDIANLRTTKDHAAGRRIGTAVSVVASGAGDTKGWVRLQQNEIGQGLQTIRQRFSVVQVNAGATLLPAVPGIKWRMVDATMIAVGGAVGAATTVDILATLSAASRKLLAVAIAALTQSAVVRAGAANATVLADGASFTANDANTAITVGKTGSDATTATHVDVEMQYVAEPA